MIVFPNCKINLGLRILSKRADGFHNIESVFYPVKWCDAVEVIESKNFSFGVYGGAIDGNAAENLCVKAYKLLKKQFNLPQVRMCLLKNIPAGAGLGGGSSDAAFTLKLLNDFFSLNLSVDKLKSLAAQLGSDCPFFIENEPAFVSGVGDQLQPIELDLLQYQIVIVHPRIEVNTSQAYQKLDEGRNEKSKMPEVYSDKKNVSLLSITQKPIHEWKEFLTNDFEEIIFSLHPQLSTIKQQFYDKGAIYASMSGSGSAVYGIFEQQPEQLIFDNEWKIFIGKLDLTKDR